MRPLTFCSIEPLSSGTLNFWFGTRQNFILQGPLKKKRPVKIFSGLLSHIENYLALNIHKDLQFFLHTLNLSHLSR
jgi:hypothetical protein